jgi:hypothetical protein
LKWILTCLEQLTSMRINYHKSELIPINRDVEELRPFTEIFEYVAGEFQVKYLLIPSIFDRLRDDIV